MPNIQIGNAPCSWGSLEFDGLEGETIGHVQMLDELVETGYTGTELGDWGFMPTDPGALRQVLGSRAVTMLGAFVPVAMRNPGAHADGAANAVKTAQLLAAVASPDHDPFLVLADDNASVPLRTHNAGRVTPDMGLSDEDWKTFASGAERVAQAVLDETGLKTVFHHHCAGYVETPDEIDHLLSLTRDDVLGLVFDTGHYAFGSGTPTSEVVQEGLDRFADRIWYMHFKDCAADICTKAAAEDWDYFQAVSAGVFCELGKGCVDFQAAAAWLSGREYNGWICVEQDVLPGMGAPKESARRNRKYLKTLGL